MYSSQNIANNIKFLVAQKHVTIKDMTEQLNMSQNSIQSMKTSYPRTDTLIKIADYLNCSLDYLCGRADDYGDQDFITSDEIPVSSDFYYRLVKICDKHNMTITKLCTLATGNSANLVTWKKGYMRSDYLSKCADILNVSTDYLLGRVTINIPQDKIKKRNEHQDTMIDEFMKHFQRLNFENKIDIMGECLRLLDTQKNKTP
jgi:DNA-binding Xre family transcriptional regulator